MPPTLAPMGSPAWQGPCWGTLGGLLPPTRLLGSVPLQHHGPGLQFLMHPNVTLLWISLTPSQFNLLHFLLQYLQKQNSQQRCEGQEQDKIH